MEVPTENSTVMSEISESQAMSLSNLVLTDHDNTSQVIYKGGSFSFKVWFVSVATTKINYLYGSLVKLKIFIQWL